MDTFDLDNDGQIDAADSNDDGDASNGVLPEEPAR